MGGKRKKKKPASELSYVAVVFQVASFREENTAGTLSLNIKQMASAQTFADPGNRKRQNKTSQKLHTPRR